MKQNSLLILIFILAFLLRFIGTNPGYNQFHSDEGMSYSSAVSMIKNGNLDPLRYDYPSLVPLVNYVFFRTIFIPLAWGKYYLTHVGEIIDGALHLPIAPLERNRIFQVSILGNREINALFWGRYVTALFSLGNVFLAYLLGKRMFGKRVGLLAAFLLAVNYKAVANSHLGLPDTYNAFFLMLALIFSYRLINEPTAQNYLITGVLVGLSFSVKYQIFAAFSFIVAHLYASRLNVKKLLSMKVIGAGLGAVLVFVILNPYFFIHLEQALKAVSDVSQKYAMGRMKLMTYPFYYLVNIDYGPPVFALAVLGIFYGLKKFFKKSILLLSVVVPFFFVMTYYSVGGFYIRNFITVTPLLMIFAAMFFDRIVARVKYFWLAIPLVIFVPLRNSLVNSTYYLKPWSYKEIVVKSEKVLPKKAIVASHPFDPLPEWAGRILFERAFSYSLAEFREGGANYALINMDWTGYPFYDWMTSTYPESLKYWRKPVWEMRETFPAAAIEEMMNYVLTESFKPWQAPEAALFLVKVPYFENVRYQVEKRVNLNELTKIQPNRVYRIKAMIKSERLIEKDKRSAYLKADFYGGGDLKEKVSTAVSRRYFGEGWQEIEIIFPAPPDADYLKLSFGTYLNDFENYTLGKITVQESKEEYRSDSTTHKVDFAVYKDLLFPYSHGNL